MATATIQATTEKILCWADAQKVSIQDGEMYLLSYERKSATDTIEKITFPCGWGDETGTTKLFFKSPIKPESLELVKSVELATGVTIDFREFSYRHGSHIADRTFYQFAFINNKCVGYCYSSPWDNPDRDFFDWQQYKMAQYSKC
jgi:hypothetical protein